MCSCRMLLLLFFIFRLPRHRRRLLPVASTTTTKHHQPWFAKKPNSRTALRRLGIQVIGFYVTSGLREFLLRYSWGGLGSFLGSRFRWLQGLGWSFWSARCPASLPPTALMIALGFIGFLIRLKIPKLFAPDLRAASSQAL